RFPENSDPSPLLWQISPVCINAALTPNTCPLVPAERRHIADRPICIDPHGSGFEPLCHHNCSANVGCPDACCKTVNRTVRDPHGFTFVLERNDGKNRTKDFLIGHAHTRLDACEYRRLDEPASAAFRTSRPAAA